MARRVRASALEVREGDIWTPDDRYYDGFRRVLGLLQGKDRRNRVVYSLGADHDRICLVRTFVDWARRTDAWPCNRRGR